MRTRGLLAALVIVGAAAGPATKPAKSEPWTKFIGDLPKELRPPSGARFTLAEGKQAYESIAKAMKGQTVAIPNAKFTYVGETDNDATITAASFAMYGVTWHLTAGGKGTPDTHDKLRGRRTGTANFVGKVTLITPEPITQADAKGNTLADCTFNVRLEDITLR
jgi:hypothetical protein